MHLNFLSCFEVYALVHYRLHFHADSKSVQLLQCPCSESSYSGHLANAFRVVIAPIDKVVEI